MLRMKARREIGDIRYFTLTDEGHQLVSRLQLQFGGQIASWPVSANDFAEADALVMVMATGIVIRALAGWLQSKASDPAVIVLDQKGRFVIPILSGHLGGANHLGQRIASFLEAQAVITTATDVCGLPAWDIFASNQRLSVGNPQMIKRLTTAMINGSSIHLVSDQEIGTVSGEWPTQIQLESWQAPTATELLGIWQPRLKTLDRQQPTVLMSVLDTEGILKDTDHSAILLHLHPQVLWLGIGCRRGTDPYLLQTTVQQFLTHYRISAGSLSGISTIALKANEPAILQLARQFDLPLVIAEQQKVAALADGFAGSDFVMSQVNLPCVAEPSACVAAGVQSSFIAKTKFAGITLALAQERRIHSL